MNTMWPSVRFGEVVEDLSVVRTFSVQADSDITDPTISSATHTITAKGTARGIDIKVTKRIRIEPGDLVFSRLHTQNGAFAYADRHFQATGTFIPLRVETELMDRRFLYWALHIFVPSLSASDTVGRETFKTSEILALEIPHPPLEEQQRLVAKIEGMAAQIQEARELRQRVAKETEALVNASMAKHFEFSGARTTLADYARVQGGYAFPSTSYAESGTHQVLRIGNVRDGFLDLSKAPVWWNPANDARVMRYELAPGELVISMTGTRNKRDYGFIAKVPHKARLLLNQRVGKLMVKRDIDHDYLYYFLRSPFFRDNLFPSATGTANQANVGNKDIERVPFAPPESLPEQRQIVAELDALQVEVKRLKHLQDETATELDALLPSILGRAFEGEL